MVENFALSLAGKYEAVVKLQYNNIFVVAYLYKVFRFEIKVQ